MPGRVTPRASELLRVRRRKVGEILEQAPDGGEGTAVMGEKVPNGTGPGGRRLKTVARNLESPPD